MKIEIGDFIQIYDKRDDAKEWKAKIWQDCEVLEITDVRRVCSVDVE